ncbi:cysteine desulfurase family protein [Thalassobacillus hwangdonensis]|uniref:Cysteine desulfurase family protein n=1 Tax=Thalassobacillus hwangdonensis TaxID=546108 RepID=A0ABW3KYU8_9BACI
MIYLDNSATTKPHKEVLASFHKVAETYFANPSSIHHFGSEAERLLQQSKKQAAQLLAVKPEEVIFTSGGTEGNNMAIKGIALQHQNRGKHIITSSIEHPSVLEACRSLESLGFEVTYLPVNEFGEVSPSDVENAIKDDTILISIMSVNNEIGTIQPIKEIGKIASSHHKLFFHVDHVQGLGKHQLDIKGHGIDLCTFSGHKIHGLKGTGALYVKNGTTLFPLMHGGSQEASLRSGTENLAGIVSFVKALRLILEAEKTNRDKMTEMNQFLREKINEMSGVVLNSPEEAALHILNFSVPGLKPEVIIHSLGKKEIFISTKSACSSKDADESAVLAACGMEHDRTVSALRVSLSYENSIDEVRTFCEQLEQTINELHEVMG